jgi:uncharacterized membrane protein YphA (DoxX/SURF4 family)
MVVTELVLRSMLGVVLLASAAAKIAAGRNATAGDMARAGILGWRVARPLSILLPTVEVLLGAGLLAGVELRTVSAAAFVFLVAVSLYLVVAIARGQAGEPCACFGAASRATVGWRSVARNAALVAGCVIPLVATPHGRLHVVGVPVLQTVRSAPGSNAGDYALAIALGVAILAAGAMAEAAARLWVPRDVRRAARAAVATLLTTGSDA